MRLGLGPENSSCEATRSESPARKCQEGCGSSVLTTRVPLYLLTDHYKIAVSAQIVYRRTGSLYCVGSDHRSRRRRKVLSAAGRHPHLGRRIDQSRHRAGQNHRDPRTFGMRKIHASPHLTGLSEPTAGTLLWHGKPLTGKCPTWPSFSKASPCSPGSR